MQMWAGLAWGKCMYHVACMRNCNDFLLRVIDDVKDRPNLTRAVFGELQVFQNTATQRSWLVVCSFAVTSSLALLAAAAQQRYSRIVTPDHPNRWRSSILSLVHLHGMDYSGSGSGSRRSANGEELVGYLTASFLSLEKKKVYTS